MEVAEPLREDILEVLRAVNFVLDALDVLLVNLALLNVFAERVDALVKLFREIVVQL